MAYTPMIFKLRLRHTPPSRGSFMAVANQPRIGSRASRWGWAAVVTAGVVAGALLPENPLRDATTLQSVSDVTLSVPLGYVLLAPFCNVLDALTLLSAGQHFALLATVALLLVAWSGVRALRPRARARRDIGIAWARTAVLVLGVYAACIFIPRPKVALTVTDPDVVVVDFHSHTDFSRDGRKGFGVERNRDWHRAGGWNAAYIADHLAFEGAALGMATNPARAGDGTVLLPAVECRDYGAPLVVLGVTAGDVEALRARAVNSRARLPYNAGHAVIQTIPATLRDVARFETWVGDLVGIEVSDASPYGLEQVRREHARLLAIARKRNLALVTGSNNHGWTHTAAAWSLLRIPSWRALAPETLDLTIQNLLRQEGFHAVRAIERYAADTGPTTLGLAATAPAVAWRILATMSARERASWLLWIWGLALVLRSRRSTRVTAQ